MNSSSLLNDLFGDILMFPNMHLQINNINKFVLFFTRFQVHVRINCNRKLYAYLHIFVQGYAAALDETKSSADIYIGLNETGITALHCYRLFIQLFRHILPCHNLQFHLLPNIILYLEHLNINQAGCKEFPRMLFETFYLMHAQDVWKNTPVTSSSWFEQQVNEGKQRKVLPKFNIV